ncbi:MAG TPA: 2-dehydropantoate 2-reductase [Geminicoccaceae bacterium]|nr:2-dehydropantoate 2-reductase [Geminicoccaceae bacterium]
MRIGVMGTGGVGGYFGGRLAASGQDVAFIARGAHLAAMRANGLRIESALGNATIPPAQASDDPAAIGPVDLVVFAVKLYDTESAAEAIRPLIGPHTGVLTFQNGVTGTEVLARKLGPEHVLGGVAKIAAVIAEPGVIRHTGTMAELVFGETDGRASARTEALSAALDAAGVTHAVSDDIRCEIWDKMVFLSTFAGLTSLLRLPIGPIRSDPDTRRLLRDGLAEALAVARASGVGLPEELVDRILARIDRLPDVMKSSMLQDLEGGRRLELAWLSGTIARMGRDLGIATPVHALIATALKLHAQGRG